MNFCLHGSARTVKEAVERAQRAEALGFEAIFFADSQMNNVDPYQAMAHVRGEHENHSLRHRRDQHGLPRPDDHGELLRDAE